MASNAFPKPLVLVYKKRRYDGGHEIEMIEQIERMYQARKHGLPGSPLAFHSTVGEQVQWEHSLKAPKAKRRSKGFLYRVKEVCKAFLMPEVQLLIGVFGIVLGVILFSPGMKNFFDKEATLKCERAFLFRQSWLVIRKGILGALCAPWAALKACF
jgi:hypothetical protein